MANKPCPRCGSTIWWFRDDEFCSRCMTLAEKSRELPHLYPPKEEPFDPVEHEQKLNALLNRRLVELILDGRWPMKDDGRPVFTHTIEWTRCGKHTWVERRYW